MPTAPWPPPVARGSELATSSPCTIHPHRKGVFDMTKKAVLFLGIASLTLGSAWADTSGQEAGTAAGTPQENVGAQGTDGSGYQGSPSAGSLGDQQAGTTGSTTGSTPSQNTTTS